MARELTTTINAQLKTVLTSSTGLTVTTSGNTRTALSWPSGTSAGMCDQSWESIGRSLGAGAAELLDLYGSLTNEQGETINFARVQAIYVVNNGTNNGDTVRLGGASNTAAVGVVSTGTFDIRGGTSGGGLLLFASDNGYTITNTSADKLQVSNPGTNAITYDIHIVGTR